MWGWCHCPPPAAHPCPDGTDRLRRWALALLPEATKGTAPGGSGDTGTVTQGTLLAWLSRTGLKLVSGISGERREGRVKLT